MTDPREEDSPEIRLANVCLLTQVRDDLRFLRVDAVRGAIELADRVGEWRPFASVDPSVAELVADRLRSMGMVPDDAMHDPCTGRLTIVVPTDRHRFEVFSFREGRNLVVVRYLSPELLERTWLWPDPPEPEPQPLVEAREAMQRGDSSAAMTTLREYAEHEPPGPGLLQALGMMAGVATELGHLRVRVMIDEERLGHARQVPGAAYDVIEGLLFTADVLREDGEREAAEERVLEALELAREVQLGLPLHLGALDLLEEIRRARGASAAAADARRELDDAVEKLTACPADPAAARIEPAVKGVVPAEDKD